MEIFFVFLLLGLILFIGYISEIIFQRTDIPDVLLLMLVGVLIGSVFKLADPSKLEFFTPYFTVFALIYILFEGALHLNIVKIIKDVPKSIKVTVIAFSLSSIVVAFASWVITQFTIAPLSFSGALLLGFIVGGSTSIVIIPILSKISLTQETKDILILESAFNDVLCIVAAVTLIEIMISGEFSLAIMLNKLLSSFAIGALIGSILGITWIFVLKKLEGVSVTYMITIAMLLIVFGIAEYLESNGAIAALVFGLVIGNSKKIISSINETLIDKSARAFYSQISFFIKTFFFVYIGVLVDFSQHLYLLIGVGLTLIIYLIRPFAIFLGLWPHQYNYTIKDKAFLESMTPKGIAAAVLAQLPITLGLKGFEGLTNIVISIIFTSILFCSIFVFLIEHEKFRGFGRLYFRNEPEPSKRLIRKERIAERKAKEEKKNIKLK